MSFDEIRYQKIENYLKGKLSESERISFEKEISLDSQLAQEVAVQKIALQSLEIAYMTSMSNLVRERIQKNNTVRKYWFGGGAFLFTSLLLGGIYLVTAPGKTVAVGSPKGAVMNDVSYYPEFASKQDTLEKQNSSKEVQISLPEEKITTSSNGVIEKQSAFIPDSSFISKGKTNESIPQTSSEKIIYPGAATTASNEFKKPSCPETAPEVSVRTTPTSLDENTGTLLITKPSNWNVYVTGANTTYENVSQFTDLPAGNYVVYVKNESDCAYKIGTYVVTNTNCVFEKNYMFNKQFDKEWKIPAQTSTAYKITILNKAGIEVYSENIAAHDTAIWNGLNKNGENVGIGLHKVIVTYPDNKTCIYNVVVSE
jgi:hypothetical protein